MKFIIIIYFIISLFENFNYHFKSGSSSSQSSDLYCFGFFLSLARLSSKEIIALFDLFLVIFLISFYSLTSDLIFHRVAWFRCHNDLFFAKRFWIFFVTKGVFGLKFLWDSLGIAFYQSLSYSLTKIL